jgi:hypothetical protein
VIIAQVVEPCLRQTHDVENTGANIVMKFKLLCPETSNVLIINAETVAEIRMRYSRKIYACIIEIGHDQVDGELLPLPPTLTAGFVAGLTAAAGGPAGAVTPMAGVLEEYT